MTVLIQDYIGVSSYSGVEQLQAENEYYIIFFSDGTKEKVYGNIFSVSMEG